MRDRRRSPRGRGVRDRRRSPKTQVVRDPGRTRTDRAGRADPTAPDRAGRAALRARHRTRRNPPAPTGHQVHRDHPDGRGRRGHQAHRARRTHRFRPGRRVRPDRTDRRRTGVPAGSARRGGSSARGGNSGSRTRHRRRRTAEAVAAAGTGAPGSRRGPDRLRGPDRGRRDRLRGPDRDQGRGRDRPDPRRVPTAGARPGCTSSRCWSGSSTGTPRRRARRPRGACGTAGRVPAGRRGAGVHRDPQGPRGPDRRDRPRPEAAEGSRAAGIRNRRPGAAVVAAGVRHRPYGDRRPRTSRRNPTGVRSGRSACRRFPLSFPTSRPVPVATTGRCGRFCPDSRWGSQADARRCFGLFLPTSLHEQSLSTAFRESSRRPP